MWSPSFLKAFLPCLLLAGMAVAQDKPALRESVGQSKEAEEKAAANRKAYDALYSDIVKNLPQEGKIKVDSAHGREAKNLPEQAGNIKTREDLKRDVVEKRKKELSELPPEVKARVDKVLSNLDNRRKEKQAEFKELK